MYDGMNPDDIYEFKKKQRDLCKNKCALCLTLNELINTNSSLLCDVLKENFENNTKRNATLSRINSWNETIVTLKQSSMNLPKYLWKLYAVFEYDFINGEYDRYSDVLLLSNNLGMVLEYKTLSAEQIFKGHLRQAAMYHNRLKRHNYGKTLKKVSTNLVCTKQFEYCNIYKKTDPVWNHHLVDVNIFSFKQLDEKIINFFSQEKFNSLIDIEKFIDNKEELKTYNNINNKVIKEKNKINAVTNKKNYNFSKLVGKKVKDKEGNVGTIVFYESSKFTIVYENYFKPVECNFDSFRNKYITFFDKTTQEEINKLSNLVNDRHNNVMSIIKKRRNNK